MQKFTDSNIEKYMFHLRKLPAKFAWKTLQNVLFSDEKIFKLKKLYNSHNVVESNAKVNTKYYCNVLLKDIIL